MLNVEAKAVIRLIDGPADAFVFVVPAEKIPPFVAAGCRGEGGELGGERQAVCAQLTNAAV